MNWYRGATRSDRIKDALARNGLDCLLAVTPENAAYLSGQSNYIATHWRVPGLYSAAVNDEGDIAVATVEFGGDPSIQPPFKRFPFRIWTESVDIRDVTGGSIAERICTARPKVVERPAQFDLDEVFDEILKAITAIAPEAKRAGVERSVLPAESLEQLRNRLPGVEFVEAGAIFDDLRAIKDPDEIASLRLAGELTEVGIAAAIERLAPGQSATAVNSLYQIAVHERVVADPRFDAFRQAEGAASIGIGKESPGVVAPGETIKFDMQVDVGGYHSDIGRTVAFKPTADQRAIYSALRNALAVAQDALIPDATFAEVHAAGTNAMIAAGFANYSRGHLGHGVGLTQNFEEPPFIAPDEHRAIVPGMVLSLELPYYVYGVGAFQLERMLLITDDGNEAIDQLPFQFALGEA